MAVALRDGFTYEGFSVQVARDGSAGLRLASERDLDLVILDVMLPRASGFEVLQKMRGQSDVPVVMLTAKSQSVDKVVGLELGADDYITKPFDPLDLVDRVNALLAR